MPMYSAVAGQILFPLHEALKGHRTVAMRRALEDSQWWTGDAIQAQQTARLRALLKQACEHVDYFRAWQADSGFDVSRISHLDDIRHLPVTDKALIRATGQGWVNSSAASLIWQQTSGSSGEPLRFALTKDRISMDIAAKWRAMRWWDVDIGDREVVLWGSAIETGTQDRLRILRDRLLRSTLIPARHFDTQALDALVATLLRLKPHMLFGYPSAMSRIAWHAREHGVALDDMGVRVAFTTSEVLRPEWRKVIADTFACGVANEYGARDAGFIARECPEGGLHITAEELIVEILDDSHQPVPDGVAGNIVITNLYSEAFPFIRYRTGDRGILSHRSCACGRGLPLLEAVEGRSNDGLIARDGSWIHASNINYLLRDLPGLKAYKVEQNSLEEVMLSLALEDDLPPSTEQALRSATQRVLGSDMQIKVRLVDSIEAEANGKFRHVICRINAPSSSEQL